MKKYMLRIAIAGATVLLVCACGPQQATDRSVNDEAKVYRHSLDGAPTNLDPVQAATVYANYLTVNLYDTLYRYQYLARPYQLQTNVALALPQVSADGLSYTVRIKPGVYFIDDPAFAGGKGRELIAADLVYSLKRHFDPANRSQGAWLWSGRIVGMEDWANQGADYSKTVPGLRAIDRYTVRFQLTAAYPQLPFTLATGFSAIVPHEAVRKYGRELSIHPVGSGPFILRHFDTAKAVLEPNPRFRQEPVKLSQEGYDPSLHQDLGLEVIDGRSPPFVDRLEIDFVSQTAARWSSFMKGDEAQYSRVPVEHIETVLASKQPLALKPDWARRYHWRAGIEAGFVYTSFNLGREQIGHHDDPQRNQRNHALRCAMRDAMDWTARNNRFYAGIGQVFPGIVPPAASTLSAELPRDSVQRDLARAETRLREAGWTAKNLPTLRYGFVNDVTSRQQFEQFRGFMAEIGYPSAKIIAVSFANFGDFNKAIKTGQLDIIHSGWVLDYPDAENTLQLFFGPNHTPGSNYSNYANPTFDSLFRRSAMLQPGPERHALYRQMNETLIADCAVISGLSRNRIYLWHKDVIGLPDEEILGGFWLRFVDLRPVSALAD